MSNKTCLIMAGGTGGHIFPALAVARELQSRQFHIEWLGSQGGMEEGIIKDAGIPISLVSVKGIRGKSGLKRLVAPLMLVRAIGQAIGVVMKVKPDVVLGFGGFASGPGGLASWLLRRPLIVHEQNAVAGLTNRLLAKVAKRVLHAFPGAFLKSAITEVTGNPVRKDISALPDPVERGIGQPRRLRLLVLGGSLGAAAINEVVPLAVAKMSQASMPIVIHQSGIKHFDATVGAYQSQSVDADVRPFVKDMQDVYRWADLVICRAGAMTIAELSLVGVGAIMVPYPHAVDDHQTKNAEYLSSRGAGMIIQQQELSVEKLLSILEELSNDRDRLLMMAQNSRMCAFPAATRRVADVCEELSCE